MIQIIEGIDKELRKDFKQHIEGISNKFKVNFKENNAIVKYSEDYIVTESSLLQKGKDIKTLREYITEFIQFQFQK